MTFLEALLLGVVQGATEFLPISSSGHLLIVPSLLGINEPGLNVIAVAHEGTLTAVLLYFRRDLWRIATAWLDGLRRGQPMRTGEARLGWFIIVGSIPAVVAGLFLAESFDERLGDPSTAASLLLGTAAILFLGERLVTGKRALGQLGWFDAILIGLAQSLALLPGISRSGTTIAAGLGRGLDRPTAARYSFLLGVPAVAGAGVLALFDLIGGANQPGELPALLVTFLASAAVGFFCIHFLLQWLRRHSLYGFAAYCALFGSIFLLIASA